MTDSDMTTDELRSLLKDLGWTQGDLARQIDRDRMKTLKMCRGLEPIDAPVAWWLRSVHFLLMHPPPRPPRRTHNDGAEAQIEPLAREPDRIEATG